MEGLDQVEEPNFAFKNAPTGHHAKAQGETLGNETPVNLVLFRKTLVDFSTLYPVGATHHQLGGFLKTP